VADVPQFRIRQQQDTARRHGRQQQQWSGGLASHGRQAQAGHSCVCSHVCDFGSHV